MSRMITFEFLLCLGVVLVLVGVVFEGAFSAETLAVVWEEVDEVEVRTGMLS